MPQKVPKMKHDWVLEVDESSGFSSGSDYRNVFSKKLRNDEN